MDIRIAPTQKAKSLLLRGQMFPKAAAAALNRTADKAKTQIVRSITERYNIRSSDVRPLIIKRWASVGNLQATLTAKEKAIPLGKFGINKEGRSASVEVIKGSRKTVKNAFYAKMSSGHIGVFERVPGKYMTGGKYMPKRPGSKPREAIKERFTRGTARMMFSRVMRDLFFNIVKQNLEKELDRAIKYMK